MRFVRSKLSLCQVGSDDQLMETPANFKGSDVDSVLLHWLCADPDRQYWRRWAIQVRWNRRLAHPNPQGMFSG